MPYDVFLPELLEACSPRTFLTPFVLRVSDNIQFHHKLFYSLRLLTAPVKGSRRMLHGCISQRTSDPGRAASCFSNVEKLF